ncbi:MAG: cytochrome c oxidase subunit 3 [Gemmataceae bacterium]
MFLSTEILFFGGLFTAYAVMRTLNPEAFSLASYKLNAVLGGINTAVLLTSSFTMALAVWAAQTKNQNLLRLFLGLTLFFGCFFLVIKAYEWHHEYEVGLLPGKNFGYALHGHEHSHDHEKHADGKHHDHSSAVAGQRQITVTDRDGKTLLTPDKLKGLQMAFLFYFMITGLHATHMVVGIAIMGIHWTWTFFYPRFGVDDYTPIEVSGLYWHFVDVVWIFVFPILYLMRH